MKEELRQHIGDFERGLLKNRRQALLDSMGDTPSICVVCSSAEAPTPYDKVSLYRADQNLAYLSGCSEPASVAVFVSCGSVRQSLLFKKDRDLQYELWNGPMMSLKDAHESLGFDHVHALSELEHELTKVLAEAERLYFEPGTDAELTLRVQNSVAASRRRRVGLEVRESRHLFANLRLVKDELEIQHLTRAGQITSKGHQAAMALARPGIREYELQAELESCFRREGAEGCGYPSIVASGSNACCLHYNLNSCESRDGDLVLIDAGAQVGGYTADVTRTFPVNGVFSKEQALVYDLVHEVQLAGIEAVRPGESHTSIQKVVVRKMCEGLHAAGLLDRSVDECIETGDFRRFYPHNLGHWLGRDVHDSGTAMVGSKPVLFRPGNVITVEPGIYFQLHDERIPAAFRGIGVRIEDNILVTESGHANLTSVVKKRQDVEATVSSQK